MAGIFIGPILFIIGVVFFIALLYASKSERIFKENRIYTDGIIVAYVREHYSKWHTPQVSINIDGKEAIYSCKSRRMNAKTHPRGTEVKIVYCKKAFFKTEIYDVRIAEDNFCPYPFETVFVILLALVSIFIIVAVILFIIGVLSFQ